MRQEVAEEHRIVRVLTAADVPRRQREPAAEIDHRRALVATLGHVLPVREVERDLVRRLGVGARVDQRADPVLGVSYLVVRRRDLSSWLAAGAVLVGTLLAVAQFNDRSLRFIGLSAMIAGCLLLYIVK